MLISNKMKTKVSKRSPIRVAFDNAMKLKEQGREVFDYSIGNPTSRCPEAVKQAILSQAVTDPKKHSYMQDQGYPSVRQKIADSINKQFGGHYTIDDIAMTVGAAGGLNNIFQSVFDAGDEVILFKPIFGAYKGYISNFDGVMIYADCDSEMMPDFDSFEKCFSEKTKLVIVNSPGNPSGVVYGSDVAKRIAEIMDAKQKFYGHTIALLSDEPYRELVYDGVRSVWWPDYYKNTIVCYSYSKAASIAGERIGYLALNPDMDEHDDLYKAIILSIGDLGFVNAPAISQRIAEACADLPVDASYYDHNRQILAEGLKECGFEFPWPKGAFYLLLKAPDGDHDKFAENLMEEGIIVVGGDAFECPGYVRLSYCLDTEDIEKSLPHFKNVARKYGLVD